MKLVIVKILILSMFISCQRNKKEATTIKEITGSEKNRVQKLNAYCFFALTTGQWK